MKFWYFFPQRMSTTQELLHRRHRASVNPHKSDQLSQGWSAPASLINSYKINSHKSDQLPQDQPPQVWSTPACLINSFASLINSCKSDQHFISADHWSASVNLRKSERYHRYLTIDDPSGEVEHIFICFVRYKILPRHIREGVKKITVKKRSGWPLGLTPPPTSPPPPKRSGKCEKFWLWLWFMIIYDL